VNFVARVYEQRGFGKLLGFGESSEIYFGEGSGFRRKMK
jgi:hypothetical protein